MSGIKYGFTLRKLLAVGMKDERKKNAVKNILLVVNTSAFNAVALVFFLVLNITKLISEVRRFMYCN